MQELKLNQEWDKVFPKSEKVESKYNNNNTINAYYIQSPTTCG